MRLKGFLTKCILIIFLTWILFPYIWMFISSFKFQYEIFRMPPTFLPEKPTLQNYGEALDIIEPKSHIFRGLCNSMIVATIATMVVLLLSILAGYALGRMKFFLRRPLLIGTILLGALPAIVLVLPLYLLMQSVNLLDKKSSLILVYVAFNLPFAMWMLSVLFQSVPYEIEEAGKIDGCTRLDLLFRIVLPLSRAAVAVVGVLVFLSCWNEFLLGLVLTTSLTSKTAPILLAEMKSTYFTRWSIMTAGTVLQTIPALIVVLTLQKYIVKGLTLGATKG